MPQRISNISVHHPQAAAIDKLPGFDDTWTLRLGFVVLFFDSFDNMRDWLDNANDAAHNAYGAANQQ